MLGPLAIRAHVRQTILVVTVRVDLPAPIGRAKMVDHALTIS